MSAYPFTQADRTPETDSLSESLYELEAYHAELARKINLMAGYPARWNDPIIAEIEAIEDEIKEIKLAIQDAIRRETPELEIE